jgi:tripartite-type tricarboxylate transporter receptor subunit TctC
MKPDFRRFLLVLAALVILPAVASAQTWPSSPITWVAPYPPGAATDSLARVLQAGIGNALGQPIIIENKGGAGGVVGSNFVVRAPKDGYTMLVTVNAPIVMSPFLQASFPFDPAKDLSRIAKVADTYLVLVVRKDSPVNTIADVIRMAKEKGAGGMTFGSSGVGSAHHIAGEILNTNAGIRITHVPFQGGAPTIQSLLGGHIDMAYATLASILPAVQAGELKLIAAAEPNRIAEFPNLPAINETVPGVETTTWVGVFAPADTPREIRQKMYQAIADALKVPEVLSKMQSLGLKPALQTPEEFDATIVKDLAFWKGVVEKAGLEKR